MRTAVFLLRVDSVTNKGEGEMYLSDKAGIVNCNCWQSPKLIDHQVIIAVGQNAIYEVFEQYESYNITRWIPPESLVR